MTFKPLVGDTCVVVDKGVYRQCDLYERNGYLYAKIGTGFIRLFENASTSKATTRLETLSVEGEFHRDAQGRLLAPGHGGMLLKPSVVLQLTDQSGTEPAK